MKPKFSGHETFPLRYGWLHKAVNLLIFNDNEHAHDSIVTLGVGKNMVNSIRYWAELAGVIEADKSSARSTFVPANLGRFLFLSNASQGNADPYLERIGSIWLVHYCLNAKDDVLTSYRYFFNYCNFQSFEKSRLVDEIFTSCPTLTGFEPGKKATVKKDVDCFLHTYTKKIRNPKQVDEDHFSSPLAELGLLTEVSSGHYFSDLNDRTTLPVEIFSFALCDFISRQTNTSGVSTIDFDSILSKPGSPGRIFRLSEQGLSQKLDEASLLPDSGISWTDTLGLRQIRISDELRTDAGKFIDQYYGGPYAW